MNPTLVLIFATLVQVMMWFSLFNMIHTLIHSSIPVPLPIRIIAIVLVCGGIACSVWYLIGTLIPYFNQL